MKQQGIYKLIHIGTGRFYIGSAVNFQKRFNQHIWMFNQKRHRNPKLQSAWDKYGEEAFTFEIVELIEDGAMLVEREQFYIDTLKPFYNLALSVTAPMLGRTHSESTRNKMKANHKRKSPTQETRDKIAASLRGRKGRQLTPESRQSISNTLKKHEVSQETREKIGHKSKGHKHSDEARQKISEAAKKQTNRYKPVGQIRSPETREKMSLSKRGKSPRGVGFKHTEKTREKIRQARLATIARKRMEKQNEKGIGM
jgi:group I intron endonuclease